MLFFSLVSIFFSVFGVILFVPVLLDYLSTGLVPRLPTLVVSLIFLLTGFLSLVCGIILDTVVKGERQNAEIQMNIIKILQSRERIN